VVVVVAVKTSDSFRQCLYQRRRQPELPPLIFLSTLAADPLLAQNHVGSAAALLAAKLAQSNGCRFSRRIRHGLVCKGGMFGVSIILEQKFVCVN
jgi:hypothetical protein